MGKIIGVVVGAGLVLTGSVWLLQGIGILPGSFMTGRSEWATYGAIAIVAGAALLLWLYRRRG